MMLDDSLLPDAWPTSADGLPLAAYLLGIVSFDEVQRLQRRLHFDITERHDEAAVILCEHPPLITVGRHGSARHIHLEARDLRWRGWPVRWIQRGGGCWLHLPGQLAVYFLAPLERLGLSILEFLTRLAEAFGGVVRDFGVRGQVAADQGGVAVGSRLIGALGVAVRDGVTTYGGCLNLNPDLDAYRLVRSHPRPDEPMTSLQRERRGPVRAAMARQRLLQRLVELFGFSRVSLFTDDAALTSSQRARPEPSRSVFSA